MDYEERITAAELGEGEYRQEVTLRPQTLQDYIGQKSATDNLKIFIEAAKLRGEPLDHVLRQRDGRGYPDHLRSGH